MSPRRMHDWSRLIVFCFPLAYLPPAPLSAADGLPATVVTLKGDAIEGRLIGATGTQLTIETPSRVLTLQLRDVSYISFVGRPPSAATLSYAMPVSPASQLRTEGLAKETAGRLEEALREYEEAAKLESPNPLTTTAINRVRGQILAKAAAPYKALAARLRDEQRYGEAAACYDEAIRIDPQDKGFRDRLAAVRHYWQPTACPISEQTTTGR